MKPKFLFILSMAIGIMGCTPLWEDWSEKPTLVVYSTKSTKVLFDISATAAQKGELQLIVTHYNTFAHGDAHNGAGLTEVWQDEHQELIDKMNKEWREVVKPQNGHSVEYSQLTNLTITADQTIGERPAGENIIDLFDISVQALFFSFPEGDLVDSRCELVTMSYEDFLSNSHMTPVSFGLIPKGNFVDQLEQVTFNLSESVCNNTQETSFDRSAESLTIKKRDGVFVRYFPELPDDMQ